MTRGGNHDQGARSFLDLALAFEQFRARLNIQRYHNLLQTNLTELERQFVERRLIEEQSNLDSLVTSPSPMTSRLKGRPIAPCPECHSRRFAGLQGSPAESTWKGPTSQRDRPKGQWDSIGSRSILSKLTEFRAGGFPDD